MPTIQDIRQQYPQYHDMSDQQLADAMHSKYYSDMPQNAFYQKIGYQPQPSFLNYVPPGIKDVLSGLATGGQNINRFVTNDVVKPAVGMFDPSLASKINAPQTINFDQMFGVNNPDLIDKLVKGVAQYSPAMLAGGASLPTQMAAGGAYNATQMPDNPLVGAGIGAGLAAAPELATPIKWAANLLRPQKAAEELMGRLSGGQTLEENQQGLADNIRNGYKQANNAVADIYKPVFDSIGNNAIYNRINPIYGVSQKGAYENLGKSVFDNFGGDLKDMHQNFMMNPTLNNAHALQSQLGSEIGSINSLIKSGKSDIADKNSLSDLKKSRTALQSDINTYLGTQGIDPVSDYLSASQQFKQNVVPYLSNSKLAKISTGEITNPGNIYNIFKNPEPPVDKVVGDLGDDTARKILYSFLGRTQNNLTPESLTNAIGSLDKAGLSSYVTPSLQQQFNNLSAKLAARNIATLGAGPKLSSIARSMKEYAPISPMIGGVKSGVSAAYPYINLPVFAEPFNGGNQQ